MKKIAILVSREPHCLQRLADDVRHGRVPAQIACVLSNHPDLAPVAASAGLPFAHRTAENPERHFGWLLATLREHAPDLVVLARYMRILPLPIVEAFRNRIINIHPSLTPSYPGPTPYKRAFDTGVRILGCTAHFVTEQLDEGPVIWQDVFRIDVGRDSLDDVRRKGIELEAQVLSRAVQLVLDGSAELTAGGRKVIIKPGASG